MNNIIQDISEALRVKFSALCVPTVRTSKPGAYDKTKLIRIKSKRTNNVHQVGPFLPKQSILDPYQQSNKNCPIGKSPTQSPMS